MAASNGAEQKQKEKCLRVDVKVSNRGVWEVFKVYREDLTRNGSAVIVPADIVLPRGSRELGRLQVFDVHGSSEGFPRDGLDEVLTQVSVKDSRRKRSHIGGEKKKKRILTVSHKRDGISVLSNQ